MNNILESNVYKVLNGNCLDILPTLEDNSIDSIVTDPPYELGFMGKSWDSSGIAYNVDVWRECLRVLKPGGHILAFGASRTWHRLAVAIEDAGFEMRDSIAWLYGSGFPKSHNVAKAIAKIEPDLSQQWDGWGTALKPAFEPIVVGRKPLVGTVAQNVLQYGVGGINIDGTRISTTDKFGGGAKGASGFAANYNGEGWTQGSDLGRFPANIILDEFTAELLDEQSGQLSKRFTDKAGSIGFAGGGKSFPTYQDGDNMGASRFFYVAKANKKDRNEGEVINTHPTVKPTTLMRYLVRLVTPEGGMVLDPFTGSGSTGKAAILEGKKFIGIELTEEYLPIIASRLKHALDSNEIVKNSEDDLFGGDY
jgi:site-specific DNA-methyltransferase (adenine-specific)